MKLTLMISLLTSALLMSNVLTRAQGDVEGFEGGAVVLPCTVSIQGDLRWRAGKADRDNILLIRTGGQVLKENSPWREVISLVGSSNNLSISSLSRQRDDGTMFRCEDTRPGSCQQETAVRVLVRIAGVMIVQASEGQVTLTEGTPKQLTCSATGSPNPNASYSWTVDDGSVTQQGSSYSLTANRSMRSVSCTATNNYSNGSVLSRKTATATLNVLYLDTPRATTPVNVTEDETATLRCSAQGNPQPRFEWRRSGSAEVKSTSADYRLENVQRSAAGEYTCSATNSGGSQRTTVQLLVQYPPEVTVTYDNSSRTVACTAKQGIPDSYTFSRWEHRVGETVVRELGTGTSGTSVTYTLPDTPTYADTGDYVCTVTNGIRSPQTGSFYVAPPTQAVFQNPSQSLVIGLGRTETILVSFYARPSSGGVQVRWERSGQSDPLGSHQEEDGPVRLVVYGQQVRLQGTVTTLTLTDVRPTDEGDYSVTVTCDVNGKVETSQTRLYVNVTEIPAEQTGAPVEAIAGGAAGGVVLIAVLVLIIVVVLRRRSAAAGGAGGKDEKTSVKYHTPEQLVDGSEKSAFSDSRWKQADAEVAENELYARSSFPGKLPPQDKRPPKPVRTFEHNSIHEPSHSSAPKDGAQDLEMVENTVYASVDPKTKTQKNGATKPKKGKPVKPAKPTKTQVPIDDSYEVTDFTNPASGTNNNNPPTPQRRALNYQEVSFDKSTKTPKTHPRASPTEYADIKFRKP